MAPAMDTGTVAGLNTQELRLGAGGMSAGGHHRSPKLSQVLWHKGLVMPALGAMPVTAHVLSEVVAKHPGALLAGGLGLAAGALHPGIAVAAVSLPFTKMPSGARLFGSPLGVIGGGPVKVAGNILKPAKAALTLPLKILGLA